MNILFTESPRQRTSRRGATIVVVLVLVSVTLTLSYAIMRSQMTVTQVQANFDRRNLARQAAMAGLSIGMQKMSSNAWSGIGVPISGSLGRTESYQVTYTTGDPALKASSPDYSDYPYRVTVLSTGTSTDPSNPKLASTYRVQTVVRLVASKLGTQSSAWPQMQQYTVYQQDADPFNINLPSRIEGPVRGQGRMTLGTNYSWGSSTLSRYLSDLNAMRTNGYADFRPLNGPISLPFANNPSADRSVLTSQLGLSVGDISVTSRASLSYPTTLTSYRIYPGGESYNISQVSSTLQDTTLSPDPITNPLGLFFCSSSINIRSDVTIKGTLIAANEIHVNGTNVHFQPNDLPAIEGVSGAVRLPSVVALGSFQVDSTGGGTLTGLVLTRQRFQIDRGPASASFQLTGRVIADEIQLLERSDWDVSSAIWNLLFGLFTNQLLDPITQRISFLPVYLGKIGMNYVPLLTIKPPDPSIPINLHWQDPTQPFYVAAPSDPGLRWDLVRWSDNPSSL